MMGQSSSGTSLPSVSLESDANGLSDWASHSSMDSLIFTFPHPFQNIINNIFQNLSIINKL